MVVLLVLEPATVFGMIGPTDRTVGKSRHHPSRNPYIRDQNCLAYDVPAVFCCSFCFRKEIADTPAVGCWFITQLTTGSTRRPATSHQRSTQKKAGREVLKASREWLVNGFKFNFYCNYFYVLFTKLFEMNILNFYIFLHIFQMARF